jgi:hypothetical protein
MCNDYAREIEAGRVIRLRKEMENIPPFEWEAGRIPNDAAPTPHIARPQDRTSVEFLSAGPFQ